MVTPLELAVVGDASVWIVVVLRLAPIVIFRDSGEGEALTEAEVDEDGDNEPDGD